MEIDIFDYYKKMDRGSIILSYKGNVTSELLTSVLQIMESKMERLNEPLRLKKKVYNIMVEALQNLYHHMDKKNYEDHSPFSTVMFIIGKIEDRYCILTGNFIDGEKKDFLKEKLDYINSLDEMQLKEHYKDVLNNGIRSEKGGGGLGMIDIARKSGHKLEYNFEKMDADYYFFSLNMKIN